MTNGDSAARTLRQTALGGDVLAWHDVLHEGPLADVPPAALRTLRGRFLSERGWGSVQAIRAAFAQRDDTLSAAMRARRPIVLWLEHDLFDQLQLLQVLAALPQAEDGQVELIQADTYLGALDVDALERLWETRGPVTRDTFELADAVWTAVCNDDIEAPGARHDSAAVRRLGAPSFARGEAAALSYEAATVACARPAAADAAGALRRQPAGRGRDLSR